MNIIEQYQHQGEGYNPYLIGPKWQVAQLNYSPEEDVMAKTRLDIHHHTDEAFLLISGEAVLIGATINNDQITYDITKMQAGVLYNIPKDVWHNIALKPKAQVLIVEDAGTHYPLPEGDYEFYDFNEQQKLEFQQQVNAAF